MNFVLANAERNCRDAVAREPIGVEPAVTNPQLRLDFGFLCGFLSKPYDGARFLETERVVITPIRELHARSFTADIRHGFGRGLKRLRISPCDGGDEAH